MRPISMIITRVRAGLLISKDEEAALESHLAYHKARQDTFYKVSFFSLAAVGALLLLWLYF